MLVDVHLKLLQLQLVLVLALLQLPWGVSELVLLARSLLTLLLLGDFVLC